MSDNVIHISNYSNDSFSITPQQLLEELLKDLETEGSPVHGVKKMLVLCLDDSNYQYNINFRNAGLRTSETVTLMEIGKQTMFRSMGY